MGVSRRAKAEDLKYLRRFKKLRPKARFKEQSRQDQCVCIARALSGQLLQPMKYGIVYGQMITVRSIDPRYIEIDTTSGWLTEKSVNKIKRKVATAFKRVLGADGCFMFAIEQQDKDGNPCAPHIHAIGNFTLLKHNRNVLEAELHKVAGESDPDTVSFSPPWFSIRKQWNVRTPRDADYRRAANYLCKNDQTKTYRSENLMQHVHETFEELKRHHGVAA